MDNKKTVMKWVMFISFSVLVFGGLNYLLMGLLQFDLFAEMFGGMDSIASRVFYILFGIAAVTLVGIALSPAVDASSNDAYDAVLAVAAPYAVSHCNSDAGRLTI